MDMIKPITIDDSVLISSTATETYAEWSGASVSYVIGDRRIRLTTNRIYECLVDHTSASSPVPEDDTTNWLDIGPTNERAMFDQVIGTVTSASGSLIVELAPGQSGALALLELDGDLLEISQLDGAGGTEIKSYEIDLDDTPILSFYDYFFADYVQKKTVVITDLYDNYLNSRLIITLTGSSTVECGVCQVGKLFNWGDLKYGASLRIEDFSKKTTDEFGNVTIVPRATRKIMSGQIIVPFNQFNQLLILAESLQSEAAIYIGVDEMGYEPITVFGFASDFRVIVQHYQYLLCNLEIEGLV